MSKVENSVTTHYVYDGGVNVQELDSAGSLTKTLVRGTGMGGGIGSVLYTEDSSGNNRSFFIYNAIGSVVALSDTSGVVTATTDYEAFGKEVASTGSSTEDRKFCTKERSESIGLDNFGFRYYDADLGRFITRDPSGYPDGPNNYLYCHNNPINHIDPLGLFLGYATSWASKQISDITYNVSEAIANSNLPGRTFASQTIAGAGVLFSTNIGTLSSLDLVYQTHKVVESAIGHYSIARETGGGVLGSLYQAGGMVQHELVPIAKGMVEAYDSKSYSSGDFNSDLDGLEAGGRVAGSIGTTAGLAALTLRIANIDVNLTGPNKGLNPYKPQMKVEEVKAESTTKKARFVGDDKGNIVDTQTTPKGTYEHLDGSQTDILQDKPHYNKTQARNDGFSHTHPRDVNIDKKDVVHFKRSNDTHQPTFEEIKRIENQEAIKKK